MSNFIKAHLRNRLWAAPNFELGRAWMWLQGGVKLTLIQHNLIPAAWLRYRLDEELRRWKQKQQTNFPHLLKQRTVLDYASTSGARTFIETGTYFGFMLQACLGRFDRLISIEIEPHFYKRAQKVFGRQSNVTLLHGDSAKLLPELLGTIKCPCLFWLDAHYSGGLTGKASLETPIRGELEAILSHSYRHTVLIDDASCFNGRQDYPEIAWIERVSKKGGYSMFLTDNIIRLAC
jgi:hypothetical protein